ncbi:DUF979 domain-containing protein [Glaciimonas soli]|uniref:DUF979 family protein n=1 Tax=Glaciimonas soli TaxID=2590999 RepID=A0A843YRT5_9BURK|nr:DUF979 domain-containing protein [Glaciimonas soli]MQQ99971.1 DUF979 family protein [Glaciimonas soli]
MIKLEYLYILTGIVFATYALINLFDKTNPKRIKNFLFWGVYAVTLMFGSLIPSFLMGCLAISLALLAGFGGLGKGTKDHAPSLEARKASSAKFGNKLFIPALLIPLLTLLGTIFAKYIVIGGAPLMTAGKETLISLGVAVTVAMIVALIMLREKPLAAMHGARNTMDAVSWAAVLPQMLAALGVLFATAGVGTVVADLVTQWIPMDSKFAIVAAYAIGMALFTMIMGNAFAAFPVMTAGIGLPLIVHQFGGNPAIMAAIGMLSGFCGTLMTPMAANFNIVPAALLELKDKNGVIKAQIPTALILLVANILLMYFLVFNVKFH